jgi:signal transduction histidine kinase
MRLQAVSNLLPGEPENAKENLNNILDQVDKVIEDWRRGIWDIRASTTADNDLAQAFALAGEELNANYPADFSLTIEGETRPIHPLVRDEVYRIGREGLTNAFRHSKATKIEMAIQYSPKYLRVSIRDNGCGINPDFLRSGRERHLGLSGMREYAAKNGAELKIWSRVKSGTEVELIVPQHRSFKQKSFGNVFKRLSNVFSRIRK